MDSNWCPPGNNQSRPSYNQTAHERKYNYQPGNNQSRPSNNQGPYERNSNYQPGNNQSRPSNNQGPYERNSNAYHQPRSSAHYSSSQYYSNQQSGRGYGQSGYGQSSYNQSYSRGSDIDAEEEQMLSRQLSSILRHRAPSMKLSVDSGGFVPVDEILRLPIFQNANLRVIEKIVEKDTKQRFFLKTDDKSKHVFIRANQGHSFELKKLDLKEIFDASEYPTVLHGTYYVNWKKIRTQGLRTMQRNHIHFAADMPGSSGVISGMRQSCEIIVYLDLKKALQDGLKFYLSSNNVILSPGNKDYVIEPQYFEKVVDYMTGDLLSLTEPVETGPTKSSNISERVALREAHKKPDGKSSHYPPGYNPVDDTSSEKTTRKNKKDKKKGSKNNNMKGKVLDVMAKQEGGNTKASEKQKSDVIESKQEVKSLKLQSESEITLSVKVNQDRDEEEETVKKNKSNKKKIKLESSDSEDKEPVTEELETLKSENVAVTLLQFHSTLKQELLKMDKIAVLAQSKILAAGNMDYLIIFDKGEHEDIEFFQKIMNSPKIIKLITQTTSCNMKIMDIKQFQNVLDLSILYSEMNEKHVNGDVKALYEKATGRNSKLHDDIEIGPKSVKPNTNNKKAALFIWQALEVYKHYEKRLDQKTQKKIFKSSLEELVKRNS